MKLGIRLGLMGCMLLECTAGTPTSPTTSILQTSAAFQSPDSGYVILRRGGIEAVVVDNRAVDDTTLPGHAAGYHGIAALRHTQQPRSIFVPRYAGLNFEHIHDGTHKDRDILFEPRHAPMEIRVIDPHTVDLYQPSTPYWGLESCMRYELKENGEIQMHFECIPRKNRFKRGFCGLFWASYIDHPESLDIHFLGTDATPPPDAGSRWIRGITPAHGTRATHRGQSDPRIFLHDADFPLTLAFGFSDHRYAEPWYFGVCREMALVFSFEAQDRIWFTQSPSGGGTGCPAWDFQFLIAEPTVGTRYGFSMRLGYLPLSSAKTLEERQQQVRDFQSPMPP